MEALRFGQVRRAESLPAPEDDYGFPLHLSGGPERYSCPVLRVRPGTSDRPRIILTRANSQYYYSDDKLKSLLFQRIQEYFAKNRALRGQVKFREPLVRSGGFPPACRKSGPGISEPGETVERPRIRKLDPGENWPEGIFRFPPGTRFLEQFQFPEFQFSQENFNELIEIEDFSDKSLI